MKEKIKSGAFSFAFMYGSWMRSKKLYQQMESVFTIGLCQKMALAPIIISRQVPIRKQL